ncbi:hypothetical protein KBC97_03270 [Candidatus Gracilibacteria bacterium]|nr:hypothetical protein [Candidatus Gracilibacteria bacterium]
MAKPDRPDDTEYDEALSGDDSVPVKPTSLTETIFHVDFGAMARAVIERPAAPEEVDNSIGRVIGNFGYDEYRKFIGILMQLRDEESKDANPAKSEVKESPMSWVRPKNIKSPHEIRMQRLLQFVSSSSDKNTRSLKELLKDKFKGEESDVMKKLIFLTRTHYVKGVNMLNPDGNPKEKSSLTAREDMNIALSLGTPGNTILRIGKFNGSLVAFYLDERNKSNQIELRDGNVYIFGRNVPGSKGADGKMGEALSEKGCVMVPGILDPRMSRAGIAVECTGDEVFFYDRASKNTLNFSWQDVAPNGVIVNVPRENRISQYQSVAGISFDGSLVLGYSEKN